MKEYYTGKNFWDKKNTWRYQYPINDDIIRKAESKLTIKFPETFKQLMKEQNGGQLTYPYFMFPNSAVECKLDIDPIHFEEDDTSIVSSEDLLKEANLPKDLIVLWWDFHNWLVMDYRFTKENPSIQFICEDYSTGEMTWYYTKMADTFDDFLKQLFRLVD
ncbi:SMI1/KNR4 family protein [Domibacillus indicus]|uniref:SMI1/KNR4 family protein n=1 Tax=Domibacillus indicus TaxID=1437523 RepID=UPI0006181607|nr:SMI1/KNR4 family protein [Domibacillus indicus]